MKGRSPSYLFHLNCSLLRHRLPLFVLNRALLRPRLSAPPRDAQPPRMLDPRLASWILEFVLRQPVEDWLAHEVLLALPLSPALLSRRLSKTLLLRRLAFDLSRRSPSDRTLHTLELLEDLDRSLNIPPSDPMQDAYVAVAVDCTARFLRQRSTISDEDDAGDFFDAVNRVWNCRVGDLERSEAAGLVSPRLTAARREMELAVVDEDVRARIVGRDTRNEALEAIRAYLRDSLKGMGPPLLEQLAEAMDGKWKGLDGGSGAIEIDDVLVDLNKQVKNFQTYNIGEGPTGMGKESVPGRGNYKSEEFGSSANKFDCLPSSVVINVKEGLKSSCMALQKVVKDPLSDVLRVADGVLACKPGEMANLNELQGNQNQVDLNVAAPSAKKGAVIGPIEGLDTIVEQNRDGGRMLHPNPKPSDTRSVEEIQKRLDVNEPVSSVNGVLKATGREDPDAANGKDKGCNAVHKPSLMDWNPTAQTYEWDDESIESPSENSPNLSKKLHSSRPKRKAVSPAMVQRRRKIKKWSLLEENTLRKAVERHGIGNWKFIKNCHPRIFEDRTEVDLKDKWRNMMRH